MQDEVAGPKIHFIDSSLDDTDSCLLDVDEAEKWSEDQVCMFIRQLGVSSAWHTYAKQLREEGVDGSCLLSLSVDDLMIRYQFKFPHAKTVIRKLQTSRAFSSFSTSSTSSAPTTTSAQLIQVVTECELNALQQLAERRMEVDQRWNTLESAQVAIVEDRKNCHDMIETRFAQTIQILEDLRRAAHESVDQEAKRVVEFLADFEVGIEKWRLSLNTATDQCNADLRTSDLVAIAQRKDIVIARVRAALTEQPPKELAYSPLTVEFHHQVFELTSEDSIVAVRSCLPPPPLHFVGFAPWFQNNESHDEQIKLMNAACTRTFPSLNCRVATADEYSTHMISGLPESLPAGDWLTLAPPAFGESGECLGVEPETWLDGVILHRDLRNGARVCMAVMLESGRQVSGFENLAPLL